MLASYLNPTSTDVAEVLSMPCIALSTIALSSIVRHRGPTRSKLGVDGMPPLVGTRPNVGRRPTMPQRSAGLIIDPRESVPIEKPHSAEAVAEADPELEPPAGSSEFQGLTHTPPNHSYPFASSAVAAFPSSTAPASRSFSTIVASSFGCLCAYRDAPQVVGAAAVSNTSLSA